MSIILKPMLSNLFRILFLIVLPIETMSQKVLSGRITNHSNHGIAGIKVNIPALNKETITDKSGRFTFNNIEQENIQIHCQLSGYVSLVQSVDMIQHNGELLLKMESTKKTAYDPDLDSSLFKSVYMKEITLVGYKSKTDIQQMPDIVGTNIYAGKKSSLVVLDNVQGNVVTNNMRQVMAKVPGIQVWESDGSGIQIGIGARGLSPMRSWEFNVRQNGYDIVADPFGYPEAYYNPQLQAVQRIEVVRGQAALQYGPQFGGMVNYILRNGNDIEKPFQFETQQTIGSNSLFNTYNAIGGETKRSHYYVYFDHRNSEGWRENSRYYTNAGAGNYTFRFSNKFSVTAEVMHSHIRSQQPGGLTDAQLEENAKQSSRSRNWLDIKWTTTALIGNYIFNEATNSRLNVKVFTVHADRGNIGYLTPIINPDTINPATMLYPNRRIEQDKYNNIGTEARYLTDYNLGEMKNTISAGLRYYRGYTDRSRNGVGDTGDDFNTNFVKKNQDLHLYSYNAAAFVENVFRLSKRFQVVPGIRFEHLIMTANGRLEYDPAGNEIMILDAKRKRNFFLFGLGTEYKVTERTRFYASFAQAYRPMLFYDVSVSPTNEVVDPNLKDSEGFNFDFGYKGKVKDYLFFDASAFYLLYDKRIGIITQQRADGSFYYYRTNVGRSISRGFEGLVEFSPTQLTPNNSPFQLRVFTSYSYTDAYYTDFKIITADYVNQSTIETNLKNNKVENAPDHILRTGITAEYKDLTFTTQLSSSSETYADANNTIFSADAQVGLIPSYSVFDMHLQYKLNDNMTFKTGINNLFDEWYFTRRAPSIPGPGALPSDGRSFYLSVAAKF